MSEQEQETQESSGGSTSADGSVSAEAAPKEGLSLRFKILLGILAICVLIVVLDKAQAALVAPTLAPVAQERLKEITEGTQKSDVKKEYTSTVSAFREYPLFGPMTGKVAVFIKTPDAQGVMHYTEVDFTYSKGGNGWELQGSAACDEQSCRATAMKAFGETPTPAPPASTDEPIPRRRSR